MGRFIDMTGRIFERLTVIEKIEPAENKKGSGIKWLCKCECGNIKIISGQSLRNGDTKSCGCYNKDQSRIKNTKNLTGLKFGKLKVISIDHYERSCFWLCECDCGNKKVVSGNSLSSGTVKSCGCLVSENAHRRMIDISGMVFGRLTALKYSHTKNKITYWLCKCSCGKEKAISSQSLKKGATKSCGCMMHEERRKLPFGEASFRDLFRSYKNHAKQINLPFKLSEKLFSKLTKGKCFYCGVDPIQEWNPNKKRTSGSYFYNGIDRVNNKKGYIKTNVVTACHKCNQAKRAMTLSEFKEWAERLYKNLSKMQIK